MVIPAQPGLFDQPCKTGHEILSDIDYLLKYSVSNNPAATYSAGDAGMGILKYNGATR